jgi:quinol monooxygenase YgiN
VDAETEIEAQVTGGADRVTIVEAWESLGHLEDHLVAEHMVAYRPRVRQMIRQSTLQILQSA